LRVLSWGIAVWLAVVHVPGALAARAGLALANPDVGELTRRCCALDGLAIGDRDVVVVNDPTALTTSFVPFDRAYRGQPLPKTIRSLIPGGRPIEVRRPDAFTLVVEAKEGDLFDCPALGPIHVCYALQAINDFVSGGVRWQAGAEVAQADFVAEILHVGERGLPTSVAFRFSRPLEAEGRVWLVFDWRHETHVPFELPRVGETATISGAVDGGDLSPRSIAVVSQ
jgi:hypothetical protein